MSRIQSGKSGTRFVTVLRTHNLRWNIKRCLNITRVAISFYFCKRLKCRKKEKQECGFHLELSTIVSSSYQSERRVDRRILCKAGRVSVAGEDRRIVIDVKNGDAYTTEASPWRHAVVGDLYREVKLRRCFAIHLGGQRENTILWEEEKNAIKEGENEWGVKRRTRRTKRNVIPTLVSEKGRLAAALGMEKFNAAPAPVSRSVAFNVPISVSFSFDSKTSK